MITFSIFFNFLKIDFEISTLSTNLAKFQQILAKNVWKSDLKMISIISPSITKKMISIRTPITFPKSDLDPDHQKSDLGAKSPAGW